MPVLGLGLHVVIALFFAIHAMRNGREMYWLMILFMFPLLGSIVYFFAVYLPGTRLQHDAGKMVRATARSLDRGRDLREARTAFDLAPTAQNRMQLANALLDAGDAAGAVEQYDACLAGPLATDAEIRLRAADAHLQSGQPDAAITLLEALQKETPSHKPEVAMLLHARALQAAGQMTAAGEWYARAVERFGSLQARADYALWALSAGEHANARTQYDEIRQSARHWSKHTRMLNKPLMKQLDDAFSGKARV